MPPGDATSSVPAPDWSAPNVLYHITSKLADRDRLDEERDRRWREVVRRLDQLMAAKDLRDQQRFDAQGQALTAALLAAEKAVTAALTAANTAVGKAEQANEKRLDGVNEFRRTVEDLTKYLLTKAEAMPMFHALTEKHDSLSIRFERLEGRGLGAQQLWLILLGILTAAAIVWGLIQANRTATPAARSAAAYAVIAPVESNPLVLLEWSRL